MLLIRLNLVIQKKRNRNKMKKRKSVRHALRSLSLSSRAQDWNRTSTSLRTADFESAASTNSATWAGGLQCYNIPPKSAFHLAVFYAYLQQFFRGTSRETKNFMMLLKIFIPFKIKPRLPIISLADGKHSSKSHQGCIST
jgi:hypothetical protein